ncbi:hypothetical protein MMC22_011936 [Lobaria immixta]|nr:hypothetical protein [Lobaria immixta]
MPSPPSEADIIFNRASVALAKSQRLIASWLPPPTASELANAKSEEDVEREEQEMFTPVPEVLGLGASIPKEDEIKREKEKTDEILRRQILGKDYKKWQAKRASDGSNLGSGVGQGGVKSRPAPVKRPVVDESDDEGGRSSVGRSKRQKLDEALRNGILEARVEDIHPDEATASQAPKKPSNFLNEVLANKSHNKSKKDKKKKKKQRHNMVPPAAE